MKRRRKPTRPSSVRSARLCVDECASYIHDTAPRTVFLLIFWTTDITQMYTGRSVWPV